MKKCQKGHILPLKMKNPYKDEYIKMLKNWGKK